MNLQNNELYSLKFQETGDYRLNFGKYAIPKFAGPNGSSEKDIKRLQAYSDPYQLVRKVET